jgi:hypothetical protein
LDGFFCVHQQKLIEDYCGNQMGWHMCGWYCGNRIKMIFGWIDIVGHLEWVETWLDESDPTGWCSNWVVENSPTQIKVLPSRNYIHWLNFVHSFNGLHIHHVKHHFLYIYICIDGGSHFLFHGEPLAPRGA